MIDTGLVQRLLRHYGFDGWLLYNYQRLNPVVFRIFRLDPSKHYTRRFAIWIPKEGEPCTISSSIEMHLYSHLPFKQLTYTNSQQWIALLQHTLNGARLIAMEYSPMNQLPSVSWVDAGTIEMIRSWGTCIDTSADLVQHLEAVWTEQQLVDNLVTAQKIRAIMMSSIEHARSLAAVGAGEIDLQYYILSALSRESLITDHPPIVSTGANTSNPHYEPTPTSSEQLRPESLLMLDIWAKSANPDSTYVDITWMAWLGVCPDREINTIFDIVIAARDTAIELVQQRFNDKLPIYGFEVDQMARRIISQGGCGDYFIHRTGHNIGTEVHGYGANMDSFETHDTRRILPGTSFSVEPGVYLPGRFGVRSECNIVITHDGKVLIPTEPLQEKLITIPV